MANKLIVPDLHAPFQHKHTLDFLNQVRKTYKCDSSPVFLGDEVDFHAISFHAKEADAQGPMDEFEEAMKFMKDVYKLFPKAHVCTSNHTARPYRKASDAGLPSYFLKSYREFMRAPRGWDWADHWIVDNTLYKHGEGYSGKNGHLQFAIDNQMNGVIGHLHSWAGVAYMSNHNQRIFGMNAGCLVDNNAYAFRYGKHSRYKPTIGCGVVIDGQHAIFVPMNLGSRICRKKR